MANAFLKQCGVLGALYALTTPAFAEVCDKVRPGWDGTPVTPIGETILLFSTVPALVLLVATAIVLRFRSQWGGLAVVVLWAAFVSLATMIDTTGVQEFARAEGCMGSATLFVAVVAAICVAIVLYTLPRETRL